MASDNIQDREKEAQKAEGIVQDELAKFVLWYRSLSLIPTISALKGKFEEIRKKELEKALSHLPDLSDKEKNALEGLTSAIINKILHPPFSLLKKADEEGNATRYLDALQALFQLSVSNADSSPQQRDEK